MARLYYMLANLHSARKWCAGCCSSMLDPECNDMECVQDVAIGAKMGMKVLKVIKGFLIEYEACATRGGISYLVLKS